MKTKLGFLLFSASLPLLAATNDINHYRANEFGIGAFGYGVTRLDGRERLGAGVGLTYFVHRNWGIEIEGGSATTRHPADYAAVSFVGRAPFGKLAPYAFAGMGRDLLDFDWTWHAGLGVEYRFTPNFSAFADVRGISHLNSDSARGQSSSSRDEVTTTKIWHQTTVMKTVTIRDQEKDLGDKMQVRVGLRFAF